ncbi:hypothetical protein KBB60_02090 [Patescibacteria group bacterium]|nr:hypothetical protein [Patescibacteria group bacterium]
MKAKSTKVLIVVAVVLLVVAGTVFALNKYGKIGASMLNYPDGGEKIEYDKKNILSSLGNEWYFDENTHGNVNYGLLDVISDSLKISQISLAGTYALARGSDGYAYVLGQNLAVNFPIIGYAEFTCTSPRKISDMKVGMVAAGGRHALVTNADNSKIYSWGINEQGQLGNGVNKDSASIIGVKNLTNIKFIAAGDNSSYAITADGVYAWGDNSYGQLGTGTISAGSNTPIKVKLPTDKTFTRIDSTANYQIAHSTDGMVYTWSKENPTPTKVAGLGKMYDVKAGQGFYLGLDGKGQVWIWGNTTPFSSSGSKTIVEKPVRFMDTIGIKLMDAGASFVLLVDKNKQAFVVGESTSIYRDVEYIPHKDKLSQLFVNNIAACKGDCIGWFRFAPIEEVSLISAGPYGALLFGSVRNKWNYVNR